MSQKMKFDTSHIKDIERNIAPPMAVAITLPVDNGVTVYVCASPFQQHMQPGNWPALVTNVAKTLSQAVSDRELLLSACNFVLSMAAVWNIDPAKSPNTLNVMFDSVRRAVEAVSEAKPTAEAPNQPVITENREIP